jgi:hypothetical protein
MKNIKTLLVALLVASSGILVGCDDGSNTDVATGDSGGSGDTTGTNTNPCAGGNVLVVSSSPDDAAKLCVGWSAAKVYGSVTACVTALSTIMSAATAQAECSTSMTVAQCADYEHQFVDSAGVKHGFTVGTKGYYDVLTNFGIWDTATFCPAGQTVPVYCNARGEFGTCFFKGCP